MPSTPNPTRLFFRALAVATIVALPSAVVAGVFEAVVVLFAGGSPRAALVALLVIIGVLPLLLPLVAVPALTRAYMRVTSGRPVQSVIVSVACVLGLLVAEQVTVRLLATLHRLDLAGLIIACVVAALVATAVGIGAAVGHWVQSQPRRVSIPSRLAPGIVAVVGVSWIAWRFHALDLWVHVPWSAAAVGAAIVLLPVVHAVTDRPVSWARERSDRVLAVLLLAPLLSWVLASLAFPSTHAQRLALEQRSWIARRLVLAARGALELDGDGYGALFAGGDCDDADASVHPGAVEVVGDGIDQDCMGGDLSITQQQDPFGLASIQQRAPGAARFDAVILVVLDAVRFDVTGASKPARSSTPNLDRFASQGAVFTRAYAPAPGTWPSVPSFLGGRYPMSLAWQTGGNPPGVEDSNNMMPEVLSQHGFRSFALTSLYTEKAFSGHKQGFTFFAPVQPQGTPIDEQNDSTEAMLLNAKGMVGTVGLSRTFYYLHFNDAHFPYLERPGFTKAKDDWGLYLGEVEYVDDALGKLITHVQTLPGADKALWIVTADHGEAFGEHGNRFHATDLYEESLRVPLVFVGAGIEPGVRDDPVSLVDLMPTIMDLVGVPSMSGVALDGRTLVPDLDGKPPAGAKGRPIFAELGTWVSSTQWMVVDGRWKMIHRPTEWLFELYDLEKDPAERDNLTDVPAEERRRLEGWLSGRQARSRR